MEDKNELKIELYPQKEPFGDFPKEPVKLSSEINSLSSYKELAYQDYNVPVLNGFYTAHANHYPIRIKPDDIWLIIIQTFSTHVNTNSERLRGMFVSFEGKKEISIKYENLVSIEQVDKKIAEDFSIKINEELKKFLGDELINVLTPEFSTTTNDSKIVCKLTIMDAFKQFFNYKMMLCGCGIPYLILEGTAEDYRKIISKAHKLRIYDLDWYIDRIIPHIEKMAEAKEGKIDVEHFKSIIQVKEKTEPYYRPSAREPEYVKYDYLEGWFLKFFGYYLKKYYSREYDRFEGDTIKIKDFGNLANQMLVCPFTIEEVLTGKSFKMQYRVGFVGCDQNENKEVFPVMGWFVEPYKEPKPRYW